MYCNLLQCHHFAETSVLAKQDDEVAGFVSGYIIPGKANTLFVWQVAVDASFRGNGLAQRMIEQILSRECCQSVEFIETTITESNKPSWALFKRLAEKHSVSLTSETLFDKEQDFKDQHDSELLVKIGPFSRPSL
jgi:L-2,4-diaminobutyric acid acetyltransferase